MVCLSFDNGLSFNNWEYKTKSSVEMFLFYLLIFVASNSALVQCSNKGSNAFVPFPLITKDNQESQSQSELHVLSTLHHFVCHNHYPTIGKVFKERKYKNLLSTFRYKNSLYHMTSRLGVK